jgi:bicarbonate transport system ATP-binding protein/nitrate/nitrite transport system ATP-binding protein
MEIAFNTPKGKFVAVKDVNLEIKKGEIVSIIGHSGCGKSTIMNAIGGMVFPTKGKVIVNNKEVKGPGPDRGIVFQNYSLLPWFTVYENIFHAVDAALNDKSKEEKRELVEKFIRMLVGPS